MSKGGMKSGWRSAAMRKGRPPAELPIVPTQFDVLLSSMGLSEQDAAGNALVRSWVRKWHHARFVPEAIVAAVIGRQY